MSVDATLASFCFTKIKELIIRGELKPGERIKGEYLRQYLGVGLSPIREALSRLASGPLVESIDNVGFKVTSLNRDKVYDLFQTYAKIEVLLLREAIHDGDDVWESQIMAALYRLSKCEADDVKVLYSTWSLCNDQFHDALVAACKLSGLQQIRQECLLVKDWFYGLAYPNLSDETIIVNHEEHERIAELVVTRKSDVACAMLYKHTLHSLDAIILRLRRNNYFMA